ncbi:MAG TPA: COX15/CtaA family protein [Acetobacteraceae bacterium]|nr:COX15/CtaA family protein [Acetobacteraceae bacterium]
MPFDVREFPGGSLGDRTTGRSDRGLVATWLFAVAFMVLVMIVLGGVTRLTGSGLSIMEWAPFEGALPPLTNAEWQRLFHLYQQIPQYALVNEGFGLAGFKQIFWLEWIHRLWGRLIGFAFLVPLIWLWATGRIERRLRPKLVLLFVLGGIQGAVGWLMVASGFFPESTAVSPYRLVIHLALALILYSALVWTGLSVLWPASRPAAAHRPLHRMAWLGCSAIVLTMLAGGFVAGTRAGFAYNTFPLMDGRLLPQGYAVLRPFVRNLTENIPAVQFDHRLLATFTVLVIAGIIACGLFSRPPRTTRFALIALGIGAALQYTLGVATLLLVVPVALAALHQAVATLLLTGGIVLLHATRSVPGRPTP